MHTQMEQTYLETYHIRRPVESIASAAAAAASDSAAASYTPSSILAL